MRPVASSHFLGMRLLSFLSWCCRLLPWPVLHVLATVGGAIGMCLRWRKIVLANVRHACYESQPGAPCHWYIGMQQITSHCKTVISLLRAGGPLEAGDGLHVENWEVLEPYLGRRGVVIVAPHAGPYPVLGLMIMPWLRARGLRGPLAVVVRAARLFGSDAPMHWLSERVTRAGVTVVPADAPPTRLAYTLRTVLRAHGMVVLFVDEPSLAPSYLAPFFDSTIRLPTGPVRLARATGSVIVPCIVTYGRSGVSHLKFDPAIEPAEAATVEQVLEQVAVSLEGMVRQHVEQWSMLTPIWHELHSLAPAPGYSYADLHIHTTGSDGLWEVHDWVAAASQAGLSVIGITDHDSTEAIRAWTDTHTEEAQRECEVLPGVEITARGRIVHVGVLFGGAIPVELPPPGTPLARIIHWARTIEGSVVILVHPQPFLWRRQLAALKQQNALPDAIEVRFPLMGGRTSQLEAAAREYGLALIGGTDAHLSPSQMGRHVTLFPGTGAQDLLRAIRERSTVAVSRPIHAAVRPELYVLQCVYSWMLPYAARPGIRRLRAAVLGLAQRRARAPRV